jgi:hypothetical protein
MSTSSQDHSLPTGFNLVSKLASRKSKLLMFIHRPVSYNVQVEQGVSLGDYRMALAGVLALIIVAFGVEILRLRSKRYDRRWIREKVLPQMREVARLGEAQREYLDPEIIHSFARGDITINQAVARSKQPLPHR